LRERPLQLARARRRHGGQSGSHKLSSVHAIFFRVSNVSVKPAASMIFVDTP
jgi:hypothetical protein